MTPTVVLLHSPLTTAAVWGELPARLRQRGPDVVVPDVGDDDEPPYGTRYVAAAARDLMGSVGHRACLLVGHSGAGPLLPQVGFARHALGAPVAGYVFLDAMLPRVPRASTRLELMRLEDEGFARELEAHLASGGRFPDWSDSDLADQVTDSNQRRLLLQALRPRSLAFFAEPLPLPEDWPDAPVGYLRLSDPYRLPARTARRRGWVVEERPLHHFAALTDPGTVAEALHGLFDRMGVA